LRPVLQQRLQQGERPVLIQVRRSSHKRWMIEVDALEAVDGTPVVDVKPAIDSLA
jgi:tRNA (Thr-GGU) A37 N-methylase